MKTLIFASNINESKRLSRLVKNKEVRRIYRGIYTNDLQTPKINFIQNHWMSIVAHIVPGGILSFRTAMELKPAPFKNKSVVFITSSYNKNINLPGLTIKVARGNHNDFIENI